MIYRVDISGRRFAENYIDKNVDQWRSLVLRGFFSQTLRACTTASLPQVNYTAALINIATYSLASGIVADLLTVESPSDYGIKGVRFRSKPAKTYVRSVVVYAKGDKFEELQALRVNVYIKWDKSVEGVNMRGFGGCLSTSGEIYLRSLGGWRGLSSCLKS
jgi:hypothetical protein